MKVWVVTMCRWGDKEKHSYVLGVYELFLTAQKDGEKERAYRGGKYEPNITEHEVIN